MKQADEIFDTLSDIINEKGDTAGREYLRSIFSNEDIEKHARLLEAINKNEPIYLSENGNAISEEDYFNFEEWVDSVGKPEGSTVEKFTKYISARYEDSE